jgi:hypothetical protein
MADEHDDYKYYSKKNPYMKYKGKISYCVSCDRTFDGKSGAQPHSSKIHYMTLDGRILDPNKKKKLKIDKNLNTKEIPPVEKIPNEDEKYLQTMTYADKMINLNLKIRYLENNGLMELAYALREEHNIFETKPEEKPKNSVNDETITQLILMYGNEEDPTRRDDIFKIIQMAYAGASESMINMMLMQLMNPPVSKTPEKSEIEQQLESHLKNQLSKNMNHDPIDDLIKLEIATNAKKNNLDIDEMLERIERLKSPNTTYVQHSNVKPKNNSLKSKFRLVTRTVKKYLQKTPFVREIHPLQTSKFPKNTYDGHYTFDESTHNNSSNMTQCSNITPKYANMIIPYGLDN